MKINKIIKKGLQEGFWRLLGVLWSDNFNCFSTNDCKGHIQGQMGIQGQIA